MEKFILFFRGGADNLAVEKSAWSAWIEKLKRRKSFLDGAPLIRDGKIVENSHIREFVFDINENARAFVILLAKDFEEAVQLLKDCPIFTNGGNITIRPIKEQF